MTAGFPHHSRAGHYAVPFPAELRHYVARLASALFPGDGTYPNGRDAQVDVFVAERASTQDVAVLEELARAFPAATDDEAGDAVSRMETEDATSYLYLCELLYHGYYSSRRTLAAMVDRGYAYHGAPQPLGYPTSGELLLPQGRRGSYIATDEVTRAVDR